MKKKISITINEKTLKEIDSLIDYIYIRNRSQAIEHLVNNALGDNRTAVILCGGEEKNLEIAPGEYSIVAPIKKRTLVEYAIKKLRDNGFKTIFFVARHKVLTRIFEILKDGSLLGVKVNYVEEKKSRGSAESLRLLKGKISSNFLVVYGDILFNRINIDSIWTSHIKHSSIATLMLTTSAKPSEKGTVRMEGNKILSFIQKPKQSDVYLVFSPMFVAAPEVLEYDGNSLEDNVFPAIAEKGLLQGHLSSEKEFHIHKKSDVKRADGLV